MDNHDERVENPDRVNLRMTFGPEVEDAILTPSRYERSADKVVWLLWLINEDAQWSGIPALHAICSTEYSVRYHVGALMQQNDSLESLKGQPRSESWMLNDRLRFHIERSPLDHAFGSSLLEEATKWQLMTPPISVGKARKFEFGGD